MEKKIYITPLVEAKQIKVGGIIMTSLQLPPDMAPERRVSTLDNDSVKAF